MADKKPAFAVPRRKLIRQMRIIGNIERFVKISTSEPMRHGKILVEVVAALLGSRSRNVAFEVSHEFKELGYQG